MNIITSFVPLFIAVFIAIVHAEDKLPQLRIVGGTEAVPNSAPFITSLLVRNIQRGLVPFCAGTLLSESWILTAAHCLVLDANRIIVAAGHHSQQNFEDTTQIRRADYAVAHEDFDQIGPFDIGLLRVNRPFELTPQVQRVTLSSVAEHTGTATLYGWGSLLPSRRRQFPTLLQTANLTIVSNNYCDAVFPIEISPGNICAGLPDGGKGGCVGDSGGPLMQDGVQIGVVSWGPITCNPAEGPSVFSRVSYYIPWIEKQVKQRAGEVGNGDDDDDDDDDDDYDYNLKEDSVEDNEEDKNSTTTETLSTLN